MTPASPPPRPLISDADKVAARRWFEHARKAADTKNYDYAVQLYLSGLEKWPDAVDEGLKPLRVVGTARRLAGKKSPGFLEVRKHPTGGKDFRANLHNALALFALDPVNPAHMEAVVVNAARAGFADVVHWMAPILWDAHVNAKKSAPARYETIYHGLDLGGQQLEADGRYVQAGEVYNVMQHFSDLWKHHYPDSADAAKALGDAGSKLAIVRGRFGSTEDFREMLRDGEAQRDHRDLHRQGVSEERVRELIAKARAQYEADPNTPSKVLALVDQLVRLENPDDERAAVELLDEVYARSNQYAFKLRADDIRIKQQRRLARAAAAAMAAAPGDAERVAAAEEAARKRLELETRILEERIHQYPTDMRFRYELGVRYFEMHEFDRAIPLFQQAQADLRRRDAARLFVGRCFLEKKFTSQAIEALTTALREHELAEDEVGKELLYWLGRACEAAGQAVEAARHYGRLIQTDYTYRDARARMERLAVAGS